VLFELDVDRESLLELLRPWSVDSHVKRPADYPLGAALPQVVHEYRL
jgi:hypothetical protein